MRAKRARDRAARSVTASSFGPLIHCPVNKDNLLRADQALRWINIAYDENMCDGTRPFVVSDQKSYLQMNHA